MTDPQLTKTWETNLASVHIPGDNTQINGTSDGTNDRKTLMLALVNGWLDATGSAMTVTRSCDAVSAADSNLWTNITKLRWNSAYTSAHSWLALQHTSLWSGGTVYMLLSLVNTSGYDGSRIDFWISVDAPFTGGSATSRPTAAGEQQIKDGFTATLGSFPGMWGSGTSTNTVKRAYVISQVTSSDGQCSRTVIWLNAIAIGWITFERMKDPQGLIHDFSISWPGESSDTAIQPEADQLYDLDHYVYGLKDDKTRVKYKYTMPRIFNAKANQILISRREDNTYPALPVGLWSTDPTWSYKWGDFFDLYWGPDDNVRITHLPNDAVRTWVKVYELIYPWSDAAIMEIA